MAFKISSKILKAIDFNSFIACYSIFLTSILQSQHGLGGQYECHLSVSVLGNISTAFLGLSVDGNITIHLMDYYFRMDFK